MMKRARKEIRLSGSAVSEGIAIGSPYVLNEVVEQIPEFPITACEVDGEIERYRRAIYSSRGDLEKLHTDLAIEGSTDAMTIIETHIEMLSDPLMTTEIEELIRKKLENTESVFRGMITDYEKKFSKKKDRFFKQRLIDVIDLSQRIMGHLSTTQRSPFSDIPPHAIVFARELIPSHTAAIHASTVSGFVTQFGGGNSHAALIARAKGIPYVANVDLNYIANLQVEQVIVDGQSGTVILNPSDATLQKYKQLKVRFKTRFQLLQKEIDYEAETLDGYPVQVFANITNVSELDTLFLHQAEGIGLFRSEYLFFQYPSLLYSEEEQYHAYIELIRHARALPIVLRVFDIGGDKNPELFETAIKEPNPVLGCRGIRFLLRHKDIFKTQLRAILRAKEKGNIRLLLPLISDIDEIKASKALIEEVHRELLAEGHRLVKPLPIGSMIEVPSAVLICDGLLKECDFVSIGTNDLVQYTLGIDRSNPAMSDQCYPAHPSVIRMIKMVVTEAKRQQKSVSICGEIASNALFIPLLIGLGVDELSCAPRYIPLVKRAVRQVTLLDAYRLAEEVLSLSTSEQVFAALKRS